MSAGNIEVEKATERKVATVIVDRPEKMNSMTVKMRKELGEIFRKLSVDESVRVVVVRGCGNKAFSAGGDIGEFLELDPHELGAWGEEMREIERCPKPVIAAIDGYCLGAGLELALSCDIRIATDRSTFALPEVSLGMIPGSGGSQRIMRLIGMGRAKLFLMTARRLTAEEAEKWGVIELRVAPSELQEHVDNLVSRLLGFSPLALAAAKNVLQEGANCSLSGALELERKTYAWLRSTKDYEEGVQAFLEKRKPSFVGE